jgi:predicted nucleic acid-binding protein
MLSWKNSIADELYKIENFLNRFNYHVLNLEISAKASLLRRKYSLKLGDANIAATAILDNRVLLTSDSDFDNITELKTLNIV